MSDIFTAINIVIATAPIVVSCVGLSRLVSRSFNIIDFEVLILISIPSAQWDR